jgi:deoxyribose-phosphate aldolase
MIPGGSCRRALRRVLKSPTDGSVMKNLAQAIDHTLLKPEATEAQIRQACQEAMTHGFATVCVRSNWVGKVAEWLKGSKVLPICVVGFPSGEESTLAKVEETRQAVAAGAREIDMVLKKSLLRAHDYSGVAEDIRRVVQAAGVPVKVILETGELTHDEKVIGCALSVLAGAAFVKTSTGFGKGGATVEDVRLMRSVVGDRAQVKASGGIRTHEDAVRMIEAGADRIGTSGGVAIVSGQKSTASY